VSKSMTSAATSAVNSPRLCPATYRGATTWPIVCQRSRIAVRHAILTVRIAGWALMVSLSSCSGPSKHMRVSPNPRISSAREKRRRAVSDAS